MGERLALTSRSRSAAAASGGRLLGQPKVASHHSTWNVLVDFELSALTCFHRELICIA